MCGGWTLPSIQRNTITHNLFMYILYNGTGVRGARGITASSPNQNITIII